MRNLYRLRLPLGKTSPPYIYEGPRPIEENTIESINHIYLLPSQHPFPTSMLLVS
jgi:hypothetical protein